MDIVNPDVEAYASAHSSPPAANLDDVAERTRAELEHSGMMVGRLEGAFLEMLVHAVRARLVLEIGTFTAYSAISMATALPPGGRIVTCEVDPDHAAHARRNIEASDLADRIEVREGRALDTVAALDGPFDLVFIDADKTGYVDYFEAVLPKLSAHGLIAADNTLRDGDVLLADPDAGTQAIQAFNDRIMADPRVRCAQLTVRDGVTLIRRLPST
ncbi:MAG: O-methyltransferase [Acidimicrobiales bacterium]|jgi:caffeoyl-CoA O-methyltransferase